MKFNLIHHRLVLRNLENTLEILNSEIGNSNVLRKTFPSARTIWGSTFITELFESFPCLFEIDVKGCMNKIQINVIKLKFLQTCFESALWIADVFEDFC